MSSLNNARAILDGCVCRFANWQLPGSCPHLAPGSEYLLIDYRAILAESHQLPIVDCTWNPPCGPKGGLSRAVDDAGKVSKIDGRLT
ncbi:hypothetical protein [Paraburkholderia sp.]|jgi:hypothetical protein|uniref:hypothetical protein n=1 Tax=Paraburkholderia sp. TaxID=1926495 RepID=UPI002F40A847